MSIDTTKLDPFGDRILVEPEDPATVSPGGIHLAPVGEQRATRGTVVGVGPGRYTDNGGRIPIELSVQDKVLFNEYAGSKVHVDGADVLVMRPDDVIAVVRHE